MTGIVDGVRWAPRTSLSPLTLTVRPQTLRHAWILSRIAIIFKCSEELLRRRGGDVRPRGWHSLVAGGLAGYVVMARDGADRKLKEQINMMIGIRTLWAVAGYARRNGLVPLPHGTTGDGTGWTLFVTAVWAAVMWHWRHENKAHPGEMPAAMARSMDFIYAEGDVPGAAKWLKNSSLLFVALVAGKALAARR